MSSGFEDFFFFNPQTGVKEKSGVVSLEYLSGLSCGLSSDMFLTQKHR